MWPCWPPIRPPLPPTPRRSPGVAKVLAVANPANQHAIAQVLGPQIAELAKDGGYSHVFVPSTTFGKDLAPVIAALLGVAQVSDLDERGTKIMIIAACITAAVGALFIISGMLKKDKTILIKKIRHIRR